jgi:predicted nucleic acid-binding protein
MFVVDTNILLYAADQHAPEHETARRLVEAWRRQSGAWYVTWGIGYEFLRVLSESERHAAVVRETLSVVPEVCGNLVFVMHTAVLMKEHGVREVYTRDMDFHRFPFLSVVDPIAKAR